MINKPVLEESFLQEALTVAKNAAVKAEVVIKQYYQSAELNTEVKGDDTPNKKTSLFISG